MNRALLIFIKNPIVGTVKTRIAKTAGDARALEIYRQLLDHTRSVAQSVKATRYLFYGSFIDENDDWSPAHFHKRLQSPGSLGHRMQIGFETVLAEHDCAVVIGSDCAELSAAHLESAFQELESHDAVLGPVYDGGYYLLGLKSPLPDVFSDMAWSTETVFRETCRRLADHNRPFATLNTLTDIDHEADWKAFQKKQGF